MWVGVITRPDSGLQVKPDVVKAAVRLSILSKLKYRGISI